MKRKSMSSIQKITARHKSNAALFVVGALCLTFAHRSMGDCNTAIISHRPISELNGTYTPDPNYPTGVGCSSYSDVPCDPLSNYPCTGGLYLDKTTGNPSNQQPSVHLSDGIGFGNS